MPTPKQKAEFWLEAPGTDRFISSSFKDGEWLIEAYNDSYGFMAIGEDYWKTVWQAISLVRRNLAERELEQLQDEQ